MGQSCTVNKKSLGGNNHDLLQDMALNDTKVIRIMQKFKTAISVRKSIMLLVELSNQKS
jgi:hypothetical protein